VIGMDIFHESCGWLMMLDSFMNFGAFTIDRKVLKDGITVRTPLQVVMFFIRQLGFAMNECPDVARLYVFEVGF
jgi:hypothetical protein